MMTSAASLPKDYQSPKAPSKERNDLTLKLLEQENGAEVGKGMGLRNECLMHV